LMPRAWTALPSSGRSCPPSWSRCRPAPTRIRYTSMSLPYHVGNGWFGGLLPATVFAMNAQSGSIYFGLWYPIVIAAATAVIGLLFIPETKDRDIFAGDTSVHPGDRIVEFDPNAADY
jgi:hypothetical protein